MNRYPSREGLPIPISELELPESRLNPNKKKSFNNHHSLWTARAMSRLVLSQTLRDLEAYQDVMPIDNHDWIHAEYEPPKMPSVDVMYDRLMMAYELGERLRLGSAWNPTFKLISPERVAKIEAEHNRLTDRRLVVA